MVTNFGNDNTEPNKKIVAEIISLIEQGTKESQQKAIGIIKATDPAVLQISIPHPVLGGAYLKSIIKTTLQNNSAPIFQALIDQGINPSVIPIDLWFQASSLPLTEDSITIGKTLLQATIKDHYAGKASDYYKSLLPNIKTSTNYVNDSRQACSKLLTIYPLIGAETFSKSVLSNPHSLDILIQNVHDFKDYPEIFKEIVNVIVNTIEHMDHVPYHIIFNLILMQNKSQYTFNNINVLYNRLLTEKKIDPKRWIEKKDIKEHADILKHIEPIIAKNTTLNTGLKNIEPSDLWRLFVDGKQQLTETCTYSGKDDAAGQWVRRTDSKQQVYDWLGYEKREPGCLQTMKNAFFYALEKQGPLTPEYCKTIHKMSARHFKEDNESRFEKFDTTAEYAVGPNQTLSLEGFMELQSEPYSDWNRLSWVDTYKVFRIECAQTEEKGKLALQSELKLYNTRQEKALATNNKTEMLENMVRLASSYARLHPGPDANNRTAVILLNSELIKHGFPPTIMEDPNRLEGYSQKELFQEVVNGMANFIHVTQHRAYPGGKTNEEILAFKPYEGNLAKMGLNEPPITLDEHESELAGWKQPESRRHNKP